MASPPSCSSLALALLLVAMATVSVDARFRPGTWSLAHATFYGDETASETMGMYVFGDEK